ncbi:hypothetical protein GO305_04715 [Ralstonia solanacearum]|nr:hypothetical protein [Ralstonia solanacearum]
MSTMKYECVNENRISSCSGRSSTVSSRSWPSAPRMIGTASGYVLSPLITRPMMYAAVLRKNSDDSTWIWKFGAMRKSPKCSPTARTT